jgi:prepilin-type N-terminal cleavage/methylation domain-containing protein
MAIIAKNLFSVDAARHATPHMVRLRRRFIMSKQAGSTRQAFTLVELLVVIGIISLLISMLLPALNRARQSANLIDCQARLRQMGQALQIYTVSNKGLLPWGVIRNDEPWENHTLPNPSNQEVVWNWTFTLSEVFSKNVIQSDGFVHGISPIFRDKDTIDPPVSPRYVNHYTANQRLMWNNNDQDYIKSTWFNGGVVGGNDLSQRKIASVKPSTVFVIWDAPQAQDYGYNAYEVATELDGNALTASHCFCLKSPNPIVNYGRAVVPGKIGGSNNATAGRILQKTYNVDVQHAFDPGGWFSHLRFRHLNNTELNALCLDGHVETRKVGDAMVLDFCTNYPY